MYTQEEIIEKFKEAHGDKYDYSKVKFEDTKKKVTIICPVHGEFEQIPYSHYAGRGCAKCASDALSLKFRHTKEQFIEKARKVHGDKYDYSKVDYKNSGTKVTIICPIHGEFEQTPHNHVDAGQNCYECGKKQMMEKSRLSQEQIINQIRNVHGDKYDYSKVKYTKGDDKITIVCKKHGDFKVSANNFIYRESNCPKCSKNSTSKGEKELGAFIQKFTDVKENTKSVISPYELDIYIPSKKLAIEYNGLYWHSDAYLHKDYHLNKTIACGKKGVQLIHIFEDEWVHKQDIVKSRLKNLLGVSDCKIYARKCNIREVNTSEALRFLDKNHLQGKVGSKVKLGLYYKNKLVSLMAFGSLRKNLGNKSKEGHWELLRFCNKLNTNVIGGASKLLNHFVKTHSVVEIISYADRRWSIGNLYEKMGFQFSHYTEPNYFYVGEKYVRENRFNYRKSELIKKGFDKNLTEKQIMKGRGFNRIYDCGTIKYFKNFAKK